MWNKHYKTPTTVKKGQPFPIHGKHSDKVRGLWPVAILLRITTCTTLLCRRRQIEQIVRERARVAHPRRGRDAAARLGRYRRRDGRFSR